MSMICLRNEALRVKINTHGAELSSIVDADGVERIWQSDPAHWSGQAPVLFPVAGGFMDDEYILDGKTYSLPKHGFARRSEFAVEAQSETAATFLLTGEMAKHPGYPFDFEFRVRFALDGNKLTVGYSTKNTQSLPLYFSVGAHEGYACEGGIERFEVAFDMPEGEALTSNVLVGNLLSHETIQLPLNERNALALKYEDFAVDAQVFLGLKSRGATLQALDSVKKIHVRFEDFDYMLLWTKPGAHYICIEPWANFPDYVDHDKQFAVKPGVMKLAPGEEKTLTHVIDVIG